jgi:ATP-dependent Lhr-like helicase
VPILLEIGKESVYGSGMDDLLIEASEDLIEEAMGGILHGELPLS